MSYQIMNSAHTAVTCSHRTADYSILREDIASARNRFLSPFPDKQIRSYDWECSNHRPSHSPRGNRISAVVGWTAVSHIYIGKWKKKWIQLIIFTKAFFLDLPKQLHHLKLYDLIHMLLNYICFIICIHLSP